MSLAGLPAGLGRYRLKELRALGDFGGAGLPAVAVVVTPGGALMVLILRSQDWFGAVRDRAETVIEIDLRARWIDSGVLQLHPDGWVEPGRLFGVDGVLR